MPLNMNKHYKRGLYLIEHGINLFELPKITEVRNILIVSGPSYSKTIFTPYHLTYGAIHEIMQLIYSRGTETFLYYLGPIYKKEEKDFDIFLDEKQNDKIYSLDLSYRNKFLTRIIEQRNISGSNIKNETYTFCNTLITFKILKPIFKIKNETTILIKFPTITAVAVQHAIELYAYICGKVYLFKHKKDSFLKDSFCLYGVQIDHKRLSEVRNLLKKSGISDYNRIENNLLMSVFDERIQCNKCFESSFRTFNYDVILSVFVLLVDIICNIKKDSEKRKRTMEQWKVLDKIHT